eukprot:scaffold1019_cov338-Pavlova_lutheri.AAC.8
MSPCLEQIACGMISPKIRMSPVEATSPITPVVTSLSRMDTAAFTSVFPSSRVQSSRFPVFRTGMIFLAYCFSRSSPPSARICRPTLSRDMSPSVSPENSAENTTSAAAISSDAHIGSPPVSSAMQVPPSTQHSSTQSAYASVSGPPASWHRFRQFCSSVVAPMQRFRSRARRQQVRRRLRTSPFVADEWDDRSHFPSTPFPV